MLKYVGPLFVFGSALKHFELKEFLKSHSENDTHVRAGISGDHSPIINPDPERATRKIINH